LELYLAAVDNERMANLFALSSVNHIFQQAICPC